MKNKHSINRNNLLRKRKKKYRRKSINNLFDILYNSLNNPIYIYIHDITTPNDPTGSDLMQITRSVLSANSSWVSSMKFKSNSLKRSNK